MRVRPGAPTLRQAQEEPYTGVIDRILEDGLRRPGKQRHTANRIFERLRDEHSFDGGYTTVKDYVRENRRRSREMSVPLSHPPGTPVRLRGSPGGHWRSVAEWSGRPTASSWTCVNPRGGFGSALPAAPGEGHQMQKGA